MPPEWMRLGDEVEIKSPEQEGDGGAIVSAGRVAGTVAGAAVGVGIGFAATTMSGVAAKVQTAGTTAISATNTAPQTAGSGAEVASATGDTFSFVDNAEVAKDVSSNIDISDQENEESEFEGLGSMFD